MKPSPVPFEGQEQLEQLAAALCDGEITASQAARLEQLVRRSAEARRHFMQYVQMHGELCWELAASAARAATATSAEEQAAVARPALPPEPARKLRDLLRPLAPQTRRWAAAAAAILIVAGSFAIVYSVRQALTPPAAVAVENVARLTGTYDVIWSEGCEVGPGGLTLAAGKVLSLEKGLAEVTFDSGARAVVQGPCRFQIETDNRGRLVSGSLMASVPPPAAAFAVRTPSVTIVDRGTEMGIRVEQSGASAVHVFVGRVDLLPGGEADSGPARREVTAGQAFRISLAAGGEAEIRQIELDRRRFAWEIPPSVARLRQMVAADPRLIHHYTFEGNGREEIFQDTRGALDLAAVTMAGGTDGLDVYEAAPGFDATSNAVRPYRSQSDGNRVGVALQSKAVFRPPQAFTVELLLKLEHVTGSDEGLIRAAVATRAGRRNCGFFLAAIDQGKLTYRLDEDTPWGPGNAQLTPGDWYYVAGTFRAESGRTVVKGYLADLTRRQQELTRFVEQQTVDGAPPSSPLGIGKGFDENMENAYPWSGVLDEVAIYDSVLPPETLEEHLGTIFGQPSKGVATP